MARVVANARQSLDQSRDARKRPQLGGMTEGPRTLEQGLLDAVDLIAVEPRLASRATGRPQTLPTLRFPGTGPAQGRRPTHAQAARDRGLRLPVLEQPHRSQPSSLETLEVAERHPLCPPHRAE
jgi:hypothetical protein